MVDEKQTAEGASQDAAAVAALRRSGPKLAAVGALCALPGAAFYTFFIFAPAYYGTLDVSPLPRATEIATRCLFLSCFALPVAGAIVDARVALRGAGERLACAGHAAVALLVCAPACVAALASGNYWAAHFGLGVATLALSFYEAALAGWLVKAFDPRARGAILGVAWNGAVALVGGTAPAICVLLIEISGTDLAPAAFLASLSACALAGVHHLRSLEGPADAA